MLMMCWFYGVPFVKGLFFASSLLLLLFSVFALKRGVRQSRSTLRGVAFFFDVYCFPESIYC